MSSVSCPVCGRHWPQSETLQGACPACLLESAFSADEPLSLAAESELPTRIGPYTIEGLLGEGGMGTVYRARHESLGRTVALKLLRPASAQRPGFAERFLREGQMLAALDHPHIVGIYDIGCEAGTYYLAMEHVKGRTLRQRLEGGRLPWQEARAIFQQLARALEYAHGRKVVHRDVKPENVLLDGAGNVKVCDFGIAKLAAADQEPSLTATHATVGTRPYMAPEQLEPGHRVDERADLYALGVVLYEMLTGGLPLGVFDPPSRIAAVDRELDALLLRALAKEPGRRFASARDFREAIERLPSGPPRRRIPRWLGAAALVCIIGGVLLAYAHPWQTSLPSVEPPVVQPPPVAAPPNGDLVLQGHKGPVDSVVFSPDGTLVASASEDGAVRFWSPDDGRCVRTLPDAVTGQEFGPVQVLFVDQQTLATGGRESSVRLWNLDTGQVRATLTGHGREVTALARGPNGTMLASTGLDQSVRLWDTRTAKPIRLLDIPSGEGKVHPPLSLAFSPDGHYLAVGLMSGGILFWDVHAPIPTPRSAHGHARRVWSLAFAPDGALASASHEKAIALRASVDQPILRTLRCESPVWSVAFSADGKTLASGEQDGKIVLWDRATGKPRRELRGHTDKVSALAFAPRGPRLASASRDQTVRLWNTD